MTDSRVTAATFLTPHEARLAQLALEKEGIESELADEMSVGMVWHAAPAFGSIRLQVSEESLAQAQSILQAYEGEKVVPAPEEKDWRETLEVDAIAARAFRAAFIGLVFCPGGMQLYSLGLLFSLPREKLSEKGKKQARIALWVDLAVLFLVPIAFLVAIWLR